MKRYTFVFAFMGECCTNPHLWAQSAVGATRADALKTALAEVDGPEGCREAAEVLEVSGVIGEVEEVTR